MSTGQKAVFVRRLLAAVRELQAVEAWQQKDRGLAALVSTPDPRIDAMTDEKLVAKFEAYDHAIATGEPLAWRFPYFPDAETWRRFVYRAHRMVVPRVQQVGGHGT